jgi:hypothetical protein
MSPLFLFLDLAQIPVLYAVISRQNLQLEHVGPV